MADAPQPLADRIRTDLTAAMKARDAAVTSTLRMLRAAITNASVAGDAAVELTDDDVIAVLRSEAKKRAEAADVYEQNGRLESAAKERAELAVIECYLPAAPGADELAALVDDEIAAQGATGPSAMGSVIKAVRERAGGGADGATIAALVKARLTGG